MTASALIAAAGVTLAACSSGSVGSGSASSSAKALTTIKVGEAITNAVLLPFWIGQEKGFFKAHGINLELDTVAASTQDAALVSGSIQFAQVEVGNFLEGVNDNVPLLAVADLNKGVPAAMIVTKEYAESKGITSSTPEATVIHDLIGSSGGLSAASTRGQANLLLNYYGVQTSQVKEVSFSAPAAAEAALKSNEVDWFVTGQPVPEQLAAEGYGIVVADDKTAAPWEQKVYNALLTTTTSYAQSNSSTVANMDAAIQESTTYIQDNSAAAMKVLREHVSGLTGSVLQGAFESNNWESNDQMTAALWDETLNYYIKSGTVTAGTKITTANWTNQYLP